MRVVVTATNPDGVISEASTTQQIGGEAPVNTTAPAITGTPRAPSPLTRQHRQLERLGKHLRYQWQRDAGQGFVRHHRRERFKLHAREGR